MVSLEERFLVEEQNTICFNHVGNVSLISNNKRYVVFRMMLVTMGNLHLCVSVSSHVHIVFRCFYFLSGRSVAEQIFSSSSEEPGFEAYEQHYNLYKCQLKECCVVLPSCGQSGTAAAVAH